MLFSMSSIVIPPEYFLPLMKNVGVEVTPNCAALSTSLMPSSTV